MQSNQEETSKEVCVPRGYSISENRTIERHESLGYGHQRNCSGRGQLVVRVVAKELIVYKTM